MTTQDMLVVADAHGLTSGRLAATSAALLGLVSAIVGGLARYRSRRDGGPGRRGAVVAVGTGVVAVVVGALSLAVADGGPGTGNGVVGAYLALVLGAAGGLLGGLVLARARSAQAR